MSDRVFGGVGLLFAIFYLWQTSLVPDAFMIDVVGPRTFPYILGAALALISVVIVLRPDPSPVWPRGMQLLEVLMAIVVMAAYAMLLPRYGFLICTAVASGYLSWRLGTRPLWALLSGVLTSGGIYVVFKLILGLSLAKGPLGY